ncbi:MAG TPA: TIGR02680 family protein [Nitriliruptorales bacterium]
MTTTLPDVPPAPPASPLPTPESARWRPLRAGLQDIWQYDHTTRFVFHRGRLLLRGRNGAGKTKVVEVLLPFLLEGRMQPARLDPFGTRSRKMHYNLLPPSAEAASAIGYVWLEFGRRDDAGRDRYVTIGAGLKARRSSDAVESWFFVVDDRRVDVDLDLLHDDHRARTRSSLAEVIGQDGTVVDTAREYRVAVNRALFGVEPDQYEALVEALLRLRQPHLSERLDPDQVGEVLADSLPPLDADRVHEVAEGFERLETHRRDLEDRRRTLGAVDQFLGEYRSYAGTVAAVRARELTRADSAVRAAADRVEAAEQTHDAAVAAADDLAGQLEDTEGELDAARTRIRTLETSDEYRAVQQLEQAEEHQERDAELAEAATQRHVGAVQDHDRAADRAQGAEREVEQLGHHAADAGREASVAAATAELRGEHATVADLLPTGAEGDTIAARGTVHTVHEARRRSIAAVAAAVEVLTAARAAEDEAQRRLGDARAEADDEHQALRAAEDAEREAEQAHRDQVTAWADGCTVAVLEDAELVALLDHDPVEVPAAARALVGPQRERLDREVADADAALRQVTEQHDQIRAEHDALAAATHQPPPAPSWRQADRERLAGAPLYLLAELTDALDARAQAGVEAALHAAGLLDAWVTPDGRLLDPATLDAVVVPRAHAPGRTLADVARPTPHADVSAEVVTAILGSIGLVEAGADGRDAAAGHGDEHWVATDGRFRLGPLHGAARADTVRYLGETARRRAREERLAELAATIDELRARQVQAGSALDRAHDQRHGLDADLDRIPAPDQVLFARAAVAAAATHLEQARAKVAAADEALTGTHAAREQAQAQRDAVADEHGLTPYVERLDELDQATQTWRDTAREWLHAVDRLLDARRRLAEAEDRAARAQAQVEQAERERDEARRRAARSAEQVRTLRETVGSSRDELLAALGQARGAEARFGATLRSLHERQVEAAEAVGAARTERVAASAEHAATQEQREAAAAALRSLASLGVLDQVIDELPREDPDTWSTRATLEQARRVGKVGRTVPDDPEAVDTLLSDARNRLARRQQELLRDLVAGIRLFPADHRGVIVYEAQHQGRTYRLDGLVTELREDVAEREARLHEDEQELLESFLAGELHEHLRSRIRDATDLVEAMNDQLARCRTAAGQQLRLRWRVDEHAPPATEQAVDLLLRGSGLLTEDQRVQLRSYLHERLREAREGEAAVSLFERIARAFDYRGWHAFTIEFKQAGAASWRRLTRQAHGTGSGGEKAVMLHLPLFAAMAAHYHGRPTAPRLIVLDEVFAGIDRGTRGQLMGLLVELDLDVLLTSHEEWGFYRELDGLSTYHLIRDPDVPGVLAEWFVWDGANRWEMSDN